MTRAATAGAQAAPSAEPGAGDTDPFGEARADPFPRGRFVAMVGRLPRYLRLAWGLAGDPRLSRRRKAGVLAAAGYLASPVDLIPGIIPVLGQLDDVAVALLALRSALRSLDPVTRERRLTAVGLASGDLDADLRTLGASAAWLLRRGVRVGRRLALLGATASLTAGRAAGTVAARAARSGGPAVLRSGARLAAATGSALGRAGRWGGRALASRVRGVRGVRGRGVHGRDPELGPGGPAAG